VKLPWQCRVFGHLWRQREADTGVSGGVSIDVQREVGAEFDVRIQLCTRCGSERHVTPIVMRFPPGQGIGHVSTPVPGGRVPVSTA
jgi:hypothetical protein